MTANPSSPGGGSRVQSWQERLDEHCRSVGASAPSYEILSDRRGGRTAWSATVNIASLQQRFSARFWYDGQYVNNAKEDAAEVAIKWYQSSQPGPSSPPSGGGPGPAGAGGSGGASGNGLQLRGGAAGPAFSASNFLPNFASSESQQRRANGFGLVCARSPGPQQPGTAQGGW